MAVLGLVLAAAMLGASTALADGGDGGGVPIADVAGGAGGTGFTGDAGDNGGTNGIRAGGGGGGAAGGGTGGIGGAGVGGSGGTGGAGGTLGSPNGQAGGNGGGFASAGGGGGGGGYNGNGAGAPSITNASPLNGGNGGAGGDGLNTDTDGGGGGGAGGYGAIITRASASSNASSITGGNGGAGGAGSEAAAESGNGGDGGVGVQFTMSGATFTNSGTVTGGNGGAGGTGSDSAASGNPGAGGAGIVGAGLTVINSGAITGGLSGDSVTRADAISFTGGTNTLELRPGSTITGNVVAFSAADTLALGGSGSASFDVSQIGPAAQYQGFGIFQKTGSSTWTLTGTNAAASPWTINAGTLLVDGTMANAAMTVNAGGTLGGTGTVGNTQINGGGTLSPGNSIGTITVNGNLAFGAGGQYVVEVSPAAADRTDVTGTATLNGTVLAIFAPGSYITKQYAILSATGGRSGTFSRLTTTGLPPGFSSSLGYSATDVVLNLTAQLGQPQQLQRPSLGDVLPRNPFNVATAINGFFNNGGALPPNFLPLFSLTGTNVVTALNQLSGEAATAAQYGAFQLGNQFFTLMLDPLVYGRGPGLVAPAGVGPMRLAAEETQPPEIALAYAKILKEPPAPAPILWQPRWNVWAGGYGGYNRTQGDPVVVGSHDVTARTGGYGAGIDYRIWPGTTVGVALAGGLTNWGLASGLGGGKSDVFQAGLYGITRNGPAYVAGALAFAEHWMTTDRFAFAGDHLTARFNAQNYGGRIEGGWRLATFLGGVAPYAAVQAQAFHTPAYNELDGTLGGFGLNYNSRNASDTRSELGARFDQALPIATTAVLALNARAAWAHDWVTTPVLNPFFQTLPGTLFSVTGATPVPNSALASAGGELRFLNGWAVAARFDGEFASRAQTYAGTGTLRYVW